jgi:hypothetical protein
MFESFLYLFPKEIINYVLARKFCTIYNVGHIAQNHVNLCVFHFTFCNFGFIYHEKELRNNMIRFNIKFSFFTHLNERDGKKDVRFTPNEHTWLKFTKRKNGFISIQGIIYE